MTVATKTQADFSLDVNERYENIVEFNNPQEMKMSFLKNTEFDIMTNHPIITQFRDNVTGWQVLIAQTPQGVKQLEKIVKEYQDYPTPQPQTMLWEHYPISGHLIIMLVIG